jgi:hypothetical protein
MARQSQKKSGRGGARPGAGKKLKYGGETTTLTLRLPITLKKSLKEKYPNNLNEQLVNLFVKQITEIR